MRTAAKFQAYSAAGDEGTYQEVQNIIESWADNKFYTDENGKYRMRYDGRLANFTKEQSGIENAKRCAYRIEESTSVININTTVTTINNNNEIFILVRIYLGVAEGAVSLPRARIRAPKFFREVLMLDKKWRIDSDGERIFPNYFVVDEHNTDEYIDLLQSKARRLPVIAISEFNGELLEEGIAERLVKAVCGLAHVCILKDSATWAISDRLGKVWSCFNGAVRLYWPLSESLKSPFSHPLWTLDFLSRRVATSEISEAEWIINKISGDLMNASSFLIENNAFERFSYRLSEERIERASKEARDSNDFEQLAELYATENQSLTEKLKSKDSEIAELKEQAENLLAALRAQSVENLDSESHIEDQPTTVAEAVDRAKSGCQHLIAFPDDLERQISTLASNAGPPEKIKRYLETLAELSEEYKTSNGKIGDNVNVWLRRKGVRCSGESETKKSSGLYIWSVDGEQREFELHLKPNDATAPDQCVRIYFLVESAEPCVKIGYIGSKKGL